jgi:TonB family protein
MLGTLVELLLRSGLVLGLAALCCRLCRQTSARFRHRILTSAFLILLLWPVLPLALPELVIPISFRSPTDASVHVETGLLSRAVSTPSVVVSLPVLLWLLGLSVLLTRLLLGHVRASRIARSATRLQDPEIRAFASTLAQRMGVHPLPQLLLSRDKVMPQVLGEVRGRILLPHNFLDWPDADRVPVLLHELAHIKRHDLLSRAAVACVRALWWFQPATWWLARRLCVESEKACDELVLAAGISPSDYASSLLRIARAFDGTALGYSALPMAGSGVFESRIENILNPKTVVFTRQRSLGLAMSFAVAAYACSAARFGADFQGGVSMRRTVFASMFPGLLPSASLSAAAIAGSVLDPAGTAVLDAKASLYNPDTKLHAETTSQGDGRFAFSHLAAGQYILRIDKPGYPPILKAIRVGEDTEVNQGLRLQATPALSQPLSSPTDEDHSPTTEPNRSSQPLRVAGEAQQAKLLQKVNPVYPQAAKLAGVQGQVVLDAVIASDGTPREIQVVSSPSSDLSQSALEAVRGWRYSTTLLNGNPVEVETWVLVNYTLAR